MVGARNQAYENREVRLLSFRDKAETQKDVKNEEWSG
jgi:hypothetical protein